MRRPAANHRHKVIRKLEQAYDLLVFRIHHAQNKRNDFKRGGVMMGEPRTKEQAPRLVLAADTARDLMSENLLSINESATVSEAISFLIAKGFSAAPVINEAGRPVGVISYTDIVIYSRYKEKRQPSSVEYFEHANLNKALEEPAEADPKTQEFSTPVSEIMTPAVFSVKPETPVRLVVEQFTALRVHRLFVVDDAGVLIGNISAFDVLQHLK